MRKYALIPFEEMGSKLDSQPPKVSTNQILESLPKSIRNKVKAILSHIERNDNYINWNEKGEVTIDGDLIPNSQIIDLIKCCFYPYKDFTPEGLGQFKIALVHINTPHTLIGGGSLKGLSPTAKKRTASQPLPPPPGIPTKKRKQWVWHQM